MIILGIAIGAAVALLLVTGLLLWQKRKAPDMQQVLEESAQRALGVVVQDLVRTAREQLGAEKKDIADSVERDLREHAASFKEVAQSLREEIAARQREIRSLEEDRNMKYGQIAQALTDYKGLTEELRGSTEELKRVLASNQLRGSWGEMQAEKILEAAGMVHGQHYVKQRPIPGSTELRPDFTLLLPNQMELYVDVKFPLNALQEAMAAESKSQQQQFMQQFGVDLRLRIKEVGKYVLRQESSVDYVILFVPSESVFEIINKNFPAVIDASFSQQVILVSPHSFFAVVRTIQESYTHFYYEKNLKDILQYLQDLLANFERFKQEFAEVGKSLSTAQTKYNQITETRYRQIARMSDRIQQYQLETQEPPLLSSNSVPVPSEVDTTQEI